MMGVASDKGADEPHEHLAAKQRKGNAMRTLALCLLAGAIGATAFGGAGQSGGTNVTYQVVERGPHHRVVETTRTQLDGAGNPVVRKGRFTELHNGMHYFEQGEWRESEETIQAHPRGAAALKGPHKVIFSANLKAEGPEGAIDVLLPDNQRLRINVVGLAWNDPVSARTVWIGQVKDSVGVILPPNQVLYEDAFEGIRADVRLTYTTGGLESDVILRGKPVVPEGFPPDTAILQVVTEFVGVAPVVGKETLVPTQSTQLIGAPMQSGGLLVDCQLEFGPMQMGRGRAFAVGGAGPSGQPSPPTVGVGKQWQQMDGRGLLTESVAYSAMLPYLDGLAAREAGAEAKAKDQRAAEAGQKPDVKPMRTAAKAKEESGFLIDWILVYSTNYWTFATDQTYWITSAVTISRNVTFQGGAIVKFSAQGSLSVGHRVTGPGLLVPRAVLTHVDDNSVGEPIGSGTVDPESWYPWALRLEDGISETIQRLEIRYADKGMDFYMTDDQTIQNCLWRDCEKGVRAYETSVTFNGVFMCEVDTKTEGGPFYYQNPIVDDCDNALYAPVITTQPTGQTTNVGSSATFTVVASGYGLTYQWYFNHASISGATGASYTRSNVQHSHAGKYFVVVANDIGQVKSTPASLTVHGAPLITLSPASQTVQVGGTVSFSVAALGKNAGQGLPPFEYNWLKNGLYTDDPRSEYVIANVQYADAGQYSVEVRNQYGATISAAATLTVVSSIQDKVYTSSVDFANGILINLNSADTPNQLQLNSTPTPLPYLWLPCSTRGTVARISAVTGAILGEYRTMPDIIDPWTQQLVDPSPSRTAVDRYGNLWIANRNDNLQFSGTLMGSVARVGLVCGGIRGVRSGSPPNYTFTPNPDGEYLRPPFVYNTCLDADPDGLIKTSRGLTDILTWANSNGEDSDGGVSSAEDEAMLNYVRVAPTGARTLGVDADNNVWVGGWLNQVHQKLSGLTGDPIPGTRFPAQDNGEIGGYGGFVDGYGALWSSLGANSGGYLLKLYPDLTYQTICPIGNYGLAINPKNQDIWYSTRADGVVAKYLNGGQFLAAYFHGSSEAQGVVVDYNNNAWVAHVRDVGTTVGHIRTDAGWVGNVHLSISPNIIAGPTSLAVDNNGKVWVANYNANNAMRIDPNAGPYSTGGVRIGAVDLTVDVGDGSEHQEPNNKPATPYTFSDMTGFVNLAATRQAGCWVFVHDGHCSGLHWNRISWNASTPSGTAVVVEVRAANTVAGLPGVGATRNDFQSVPNYLNGQGQTFSPVTGRYLEVRVTLSCNVGVSNRPVLYDLTVHSPQS
jgi:hypothetical protein